MTGFPRFPMADAPRDGRSIILGAEDVGEICMHWNPECVNEFLAPGVTGMWQTVYGGMTWHEDAVHGPEWWRPIPGTKLYQEKLH